MLHYLPQCFLAQKILLGERVYDIKRQAISLRAGGGGLWGKTGLYAVQAVLTPDREKKRQNGRRFKNSEEPMFTLTGQDIHGVAIRDLTTSETFGTLRSGGSGGVPSQRFVDADMKIRRLTPRECERLMSWPDDWTQWGMDEKGSRTEISDTQRYRMTGNGVVSNVVKWLIENVILRD